MNTAYISAGSNVGDRKANLLGALRVLGETPGVRVEAVSAIYETEPVGGVPQPAFLNLAARLATELDAETLFAALQKTELGFGRNRENEIRWGPRTLDLDLLLLGGETRTSGKLTLPHPRMWERAFVLIPLRDVADGRLLETLASFPKTDPGVRMVSPRFNQEITRATGRGD